VFIYNNRAITFQKGENVMINATQMAKPFDSNPHDFLRLISTLKYIDALTNTGKPLSSIIQIVRDGSDSGTWMNEKIAIEFAQWLSPEFSIWCNTRISELVK
jgi:hypothetical protein